MTNRDKILFFIPLATFVALSSALTIVVLLPQLIQVRQGRQKVDELRALSAQLPMLGQQIVREQTGIVRAQSKQAAVLQILASGGNLTTFMGQLDKLAALSGVKLTLFEPSSAAAKPPQQAPSQPNSSQPEGQQTSPPRDPLLGPGIAMQETILTASGSYPALLKFMRQLELLSVLVVQSDMNVTLPDNKTTAGAQSPDLKLRLATYFREPR